MAGLLDIIADKFQSGLAAVNPRAKRFIGQEPPELPQHLASQAGVAMRNAQARREHQFQQQLEPLQARHRELFLKAQEDDQYAQRLNDSLRAGQGIRGVAGLPPQAQGQVAGASNVVTNETLPDTGWFGLFKKYAPPFENDTVAYASGVAQDLGINPQTVTQRQLMNRLDDWAKVQARYEGYFSNQNTLAKRNNNPGNLMFAGQPGAQPDPLSKFAKFSTPQAGWNALKRQLALDASRFLPQ